MYEELAQRLGLKGTEKGNISIQCPLHDDSSNSASINFTKGVFKCFAGCGGKGMKLEQLEKELGVEGGQASSGESAPFAGTPMQAGSTPGPDLPTYSEEQLFALADAELERRGLKADGDYDVEFSVDVHPASKMYGYLVVTHKGASVGRNLLGQEPRYQNDVGPKSVWLLKDDGGKNPVWVVEGMFDALALLELGYSPVMPLHTNEISERGAYLLRGRSVYVLLDADFGGWKGAKSVVDSLRSVGAHPVVLDLPDSLGKDPSEAISNNRDAFAEWLREQEAVFSGTDRSYVSTLRSGVVSLPRLSTGIPSWDALLGGGLLPGVHTIGGEPGVGKSALSQWLAQRAAKKHGRRVFLGTYELPKEQVWARLASIEAQVPWVQLEVDPTKIPPEAEELADLIRVEAGWSLDKVQRAVDNYDLVVLDYLQRMPGPYSGDAKRQNVDYNIEGLSDLARDGSKIIIVISSLPRTAYGRITMSSFKESGNIEYVSQSLTGLVVYPGKQKLLGSIVKNTRGVVGEFWLNVNYAYLGFSESKDPRQDGTIASFRLGSGNQPAVAFPGGAPNTHGSNR